jgi:MFS superfamily sulfate permease-like transporter
LGVYFFSLFKTKSIVEGILIRIKGAAIYRNVIKVNKQILKFPYSGNIVFDVRKCVLVDHSVIETLHHLKDEFENEGGHLTILGIDEFKNAHGSKHHLATKRIHHK